MRRWADRIISGVFLAAIGLPLLSLPLGLDREPMATDRRSWLPQSRSDLSKLPRRIRRQLNEGFAFRRALTETHARLWMDGLGTSPAQRVIVGNDGWLFLREVLDDHRGVDTPSSQDLFEWRDRLEGAATSSRDLGAPYLFVIAPNKATILGSRYMPPWVRRSGRPGALERLIEHLTQVSSPVRIIDPRGALEQAEEREATYHKTDTHWNEWGAFVAYRAVGEAIQNAGIEIDLLTTDQIAIVAGDHASGDLARLMALQNRMRERLITVVTPDDRRPSDLDGTPLEVTTIDITMWKRLETRCAEGEIRRGLVFHDSFGVALIPYLARHFQEASFVWSTRFDAALASKLAPDLVIHELVERCLSGPCP